jgi:predicted nuclease with TOPRIM domain
MLTYLLGASMTTVTPEQMTNTINTLPAAVSTLSGGGLVAMLFWLRSVFAELRSGIEEAKKDASDVGDLVDKLEARVNRAEDRIEDVRLEHARLEPKLTRIEQDLDEIKQMMRDWLEQRAGQ